MRLAFFEMTVSDVEAIHEIWLKSDSKLQIYNLSQLRGDSVASEKPKLSNYSQINN
jgi:hypothetical protein